MAGSRFEILRAMVEQNPTDAFSRYGLAMEYVRTGALADAADQFQILITHNPNYAPAYFHAGQTLEKLGRIDDARATYMKGVEVTSAIGDAHTRSEIEAALNMLR